MTRVGHLFDKTAGWEQRVGAGHLLDRLPSDNFTHVVAVTDDDVRRRVDMLAQTTEVVRPILGLTALAGPAVRGFVDRHALNLLHAWGVTAAVAARAGADLPLVVELYDPCLASREIKQLRTIAEAGRFAVICSCEIVRRRLVEGGLDPKRAVVIRPGVDFGLVNRSQRGPIRAGLGIPAHFLLAIVPEPVSRTGGQFDAVRALGLRNTISQDLHVVVPGMNEEVRRIECVAHALPGETVFLRTDDRYPFEQLVSICDVLLVTPRGDTSTTAIAWAMAAGVPVIGTAVYSVAELLSSQVNGLLFKQTPGRSMSASILRLLDDRDTQKKVAETARGQAFEVFGLRRYAEQHMQLYENLLNNRDPGEGIVDSSIDS